MVRLDCILICGTYPERTKKKKEEETESNVFHDTLYYVTGEKFKEH